MSGMLYCLVLNCERLSEAQGSLCRRADLQSGKGRINWGSHAAIQLGQSPPSPSGTTFVTVCSLRVTVNL